MTDADDMTEKVVRLEHEERVESGRVQEWIDANALPGDTVVVIDPETDGETHQYIYGSDSE